MTDVVGMAGFGPLWVLLVAIAGCGRVAFDDVEAMGGDAGEMGDTGGMGDATPCAITPTAFLASPIIPTSACNPDGILVPEDGQVAGLDLLGNGDDCAFWDGSSACGCVGLDLGGEYAISHVVLRAAPVSEACSRPCGNGECDTGHTFPVYITTDQTTYTWAGEVRFGGRAFADYTIQVQARARYILACRDAWGANRDDVAVDALTAFCE